MGKWKVAAGRGALARWRAVGVAGLAVTGMGAALVVPQVVGQGTAGALGTLGSQGAVHQMVTEVLSCDSWQRPDPPDCFQPNSTTMKYLAGAPGIYGAVGSPDLLTQLFGHPQNHCDNGDYDVVDGKYLLTPADLGGIATFATLAPASPIPESEANSLVGRLSLGLRKVASPPSQSQAHQVLVDCITQAQQRLTSAVNLARGLLNADGTAIDYAQTKLTGGPAGTIPTPCRFPDPDRSSDTDISAKCAVLNQFGRALHTIEDFWSHSNWADIATPLQPTSGVNPPGLNRSYPPPYFTVGYTPKTAPATDFPPTLITGYDDSIGSCPWGRVCHSVLNKDRGTVDPITGATSNPTATASPRGTIVTSADQRTNFDKTVAGARNQVVTTWDSFVTALNGKYGAAQAALMVRALTLDYPWTTCRVNGSAYTALGPPQGDVAANRTARIRIVNNTGLQMQCGTATLDYGAWGVMPPDGLAPQGVLWFKTLSNGTGDVGSVTYTFGSGTTVQMNWNVPWIGSTSISCTVSGPNAGQYKCTVTGNVSGNDPTPVIAVNPA
ncbi:MAG TPA: hypothetical protein VHB02_05420 [Acidimicrobiales bacterium]|nr:hypothetical protein [Acidimicrobiales bacterium]